MFRTRDAQTTKAHFMVSFLSPENRAVYEIMWKNMVEQAGQT
jgi:hypothetical protein